MAKALDRQALDRVIAVINGKGGVLKTTLTSNVGGMLAASGFKVLLVDLDPQGNLAEDLGYTDDDRGDNGAALSRALMFGGRVEPIQGIRPNLDVFAGGLELDKATGGLAVMANKDPAEAKLAVARILEPIAHNYDMILIDCPPGDETLQTAAVAAARYALVPVKTDKSSRKGLTAVAARLDAVLDINPTLDLLGVVLVDVGTPMKRSDKMVLRASEVDARKHIAELFNSDSDVVLKATIRHSEATAHATRERGLLVAELDEHVRKGPKWYEVRRGDAAAASLAPQAAGSVADDLHAITQEIVERITVSESAATEGQLA